MGLSCSCSAATAAAAGVWRSGWSHRNRASTGSVAASHACLLGVIQVGAVVLDPEGDVLAVGVIVDGRMTPLNQHRPSALGPQPNEVHAVVNAEAPQGCHWWALAANDIVEPLVEASHRRRRAFVMDHLSICGSDPDWFTQLRHALAVRHIVLSQQVKAAAGIHQPAADAVIDR